MAVFRPFKAVRPDERIVDKVAALPYDVMSSREAREMVKDNPHSFLHVDRAEIDLDPSVDIYDASVYARAAMNLEEMLADGTNIAEDKPVYYIYRQVMDGRAQAGIVGCASIDDYMNNVIRKHELTRADKEEDRIRHVDTCNANTGPIFLTFRDNGEIGRFTSDWMASHQPIYDFTSDDGITHTVWKVDEVDAENRLYRHFQDIPCFYIADGHHRSASAVRVGQMRREEHPDYDGTEEFNFFLSVLFPSDELRIYDYNRVVHDLNGLSEEEFLAGVRKKFDVKTCDGEDSIISPAMNHMEDSEGTGCAGKGILERYRPVKKHEFGMYLSGKWYRLTAKEGTFDANDPVSRLDVSILQENLLSPVLGIGDPRTDGRISFIGGIRGLNELVRKVDGGDAVAFAMYPTTIEDLMDIADAGAIMPPKSTWFEPKLRSGLFIHYLS
ncbi:MAG: DUF1015 family protein [Lachnospiraceae bacterium]|nr:DUF1015 family protein [Lachnospiraceae bacterium]